MRMRWTQVKTRFNSYISLTLPPLFHQQSLLLVPTHQISVAMESQRKTNHEGDNNRTATNSPPPFSALTSLSLHDIHQMLQPFHHDQLVELLHGAAIRHADVLVSIRDFADGDTTLRRLFIRSLDGETTSEILHRVFSPFGEIEEAVVIVDKSTGRSKGFGFVTFKHLEGAYLALKNPSKRIDGRMTVTHLASARISNLDDHASSRKIFVSNIPFQIPSGKLLDHFSRYGEVEEGPLAFDRASCGREKGFAFFIYKTEAAAKAAIRQPLKVIDGYRLHCKLSVEYKKLNTPAQMQQKSAFQFSHMMAPQHGGYGGGVQDQGQGCTTLHVSPPMAAESQFGDSSGGRGGGSSSDGGGRCASPPPPSLAVGVPANARGSQSQGSSSHHQRQQQQPKPGRKLLPRGMYHVKSPYL